MILAPAMQVCKYRNIPRHTPFRSKYAIFKYITRIPCHSFLIYTVKSCRFVIYFKLLIFLRLKYSIRFKYNYKLNYIQSSAFCYFFTLRCIFTFIWSVSTYSIPYTLHIVDDLNSILSVCDSVSYFVC